MGKIDKYLPKLPLVSDYGQVVRKTNDRIVE